MTTLTARHLVAATPNVLSTLRLLLAIVLPALDPRWWGPAVLIAAITDLLDGYIARRFGATSWQGGLLDGAADKLFVLSALLTLTWHALLLPWETALLLARDGIVVTMVLYLAATRRWHAFARMPSQLPGKVATAAIYLLLVILTFWPEAGLLGAAARYTAFAAVIAASVNYLTIFYAAKRAEGAPARTEA